jgi:broad specificity phosphatase PhoE
MKQLQNLHNTYFAIRHGQSEANIQRLVISHPANGIPAYGLTDIGKEQAKESITQAKQQGILNEQTLIISSPFKRAKETAEIAQEILGTKDIVYRDELAERHFGVVEKTTFDYTLIWDEDGKDPHHTLHEVESTSAVQKRTIGLIEDLEKLYKNQTILLVSHGDILQILQTAFAGISSGHHRSLAHMENAEIRKLNP